MALSATAKIIRAAIDAAPMGPSLDEAAEALAVALDDAGYVIRKKPASRKPAAPVQVFAPNTGDAALDEFMRNHHDPKYRPAKMPTSPGMPSITIPAKQRDDIESAWTRACEQRKANEEMRAEDAEILREVVALHRNPWHFERIDIYSGESHRVYTSPRHPDIEIWTRADRSALAQVYVGRKRITPPSGYAFAPREAEKAADTAAARRAA